MKKLHKLCLWLIVFSAWLAEVYIYDMWNYFQMAWNSSRSPSPLSSRTLPPTMCTRLARKTWENLPTKQCRPKTHCRKKFEAAASKDWTQPKMLGQNGPPLAPMFPAGFTRQLQDWMFLSWTSLDRSAAMGLKTVCSDTPVILEELSLLER